MNAKQSNVVISVEIDAVVRASFEECRTMNLTAFVIEDRAKAIRAFRNLCDFLASLGVSLAHYGL